MGTLYLNAAGDAPSSKCQELQFPYICCRCRVQSACLLQDARKGVLFDQLPPVLQLQLKRFEYDFARDTMVKVRLQNWRCI